MKNKKIKIESTKKYIVSRSVNISISEDGKFVVHNSMSRPIKELTIDHLLILNTFLNPITFQEAYSILKNIYDVSKSDLDAIITQLLNLNIITIDSVKPKAIATSDTGFASIGMHHFMVRDTVRVMAYKTAIMSKVNGKSVVDLGCGTGILSLFAAKSGAVHVTAIEESSISIIAKKMFKANKVEGLITLKKGNSKDVAIPEKVDVLIHEIIGMDPLDENILAYISDAKKRFLKNKGTLIPSKMEICCVAYEEDTLDYFMKEADAFEDLYGISFDPYKESMKKTPIEELRKFTDFRDKEFGKRKEISEETVLFSLDFNEDFNSEREYKKTISLKLIRDGFLSGVLIYFKAHLTEEIILSTSPFSKPTHWGQKNIAFRIPMLVRNGTNVKMNTEIKKENGQNKVHVNLV
jgi:ubiquinone/menaquinone biosynthesis C-methylase UbiE